MRNPIHDMTPGWLCLPMRLSAGIVWACLVFAGSVWGQMQAGPPGPPPGRSRIGEVLRDRAIDWQSPAGRSMAVQRIREIENLNLEAARAEARRQGKPLRTVLPSGRVMEVAGIDEDGRLLYHATANINAAISTGASLLNAAPYLLNGTNLTVGVWDGGAVRNTHQEFVAGSRVTIMDGAAFDNHATHVGGTIAAAGVQASAKGMAPVAKVDSYNWDNDTSEMLGRAAGAPGQTNKIYLSNHSYTYLAGWTWNGVNYSWSGTGTDQNAYDPFFGQYHSKASEWDSAAYNYPYYLIFKAAGNDNGERPSNGSTVVIAGSNATYDSAIHPPGDGVRHGGFDTLSTFSNAKNVITVGSVNDAVTSGVRDPTKATISSFSSWGPTDDGRIKPDIVANGAGLYSPLADSDNAYTSYSGTSMASPNAAGSAALLVELYRNLFAGGAMLASTLKGLIIHTADDLGRPGPDYTFGWGLMNVKAAADLLIDHHSNSNTTRLLEHQVTTAVPSQTYPFLWDGVSPIRATLCWTDPAGTPIGTHDDRTARLVNDLDLKITAPDSSEYLPFIMPFVGTWTTESMSANATTGTNNVDNVEQVLIPNPLQQGVWTVQVTTKGTLTNGAQTFSLLLSGLDNAPLSMEVSRGGMPVAGGGVNGVSGTTAGVSTQITYTVSNVGGGDLALTTPVTISGTNNCSVTVNTQPSSPIGTAGSTSLVLAVTPAAGGTWSFNVSIVNNDPLKNPYHWTVTGVASAGGTTTFVAAADTYIDQLNPTVAYGSATLFSAWSRTSNFRYGFLRFDLTSIAAGTTLNSATLDLTEDNAKSGSVDIYEATGAWTEAGATWDNSSNLLGTTLFGTVTAPGVAGTAVPVINLNASGISKVQSWVNTPAGNYGFGVKTGNTGPNANIDLRSREHATEANRPRLTITYGSASTAPLMVVTSGGRLIAAGSTDPIADTETGIGRSLTYAVGNLGSTNLTLATPVTISSSNNCAVTVNTQPASPVAPADSTELILTVTPAAAGAWSATISITNSDADKNPYTWILSGTAYPRYAVTYNGNSNSSGVVPVDTSSPYLPVATVTVLGNTGNLARTGFAFDGWNTAANGSGISYAPGATFAMPEANVTLYAKWNGAPVVDAGTNQTVYLTGSGAWTPAAILGSVEFWLDAADAATITASGGKVSKWDDKSGNNRHVSQDGSLSQPTYSSSSVSFDGTDDYLWNSSAFMSTKGSLDIFIVASIPAQNDRRIIAEASSSNTTTLYALAQTKNDNNGTMGGFVRNDGSTILVNHPSLSATGAFNNTTRIYHWRDTGSSVSGRFNGGTEITSSYTRSGTFTAADRFAVGALLRSGGALSFAQGAINEIVIADVLTDPAVREQVEGYLAHKWGVAANLPAGHPYQDIAPSGNSAVASLIATAVDPDGDDLTLQWTKVDGPTASVAFADSSALETTATFGYEGVYTLRLTADDGVQQAQDEVVITVAPAPVFYAVIYDGNGNSGGSPPVDPNSPYESGTIVTVLGNTGTLVRTGYTFAGWNTLANGNGTAYVADNTFEITANTTLYAQWTPIDYTVTFQPGAHGSLQGGTPNVVHSVAYGSAAPTPPTVVPDAEYTFSGWDPPLPATITGDFSTTAQYTLKTYTLTVNNGSGDGSYPAGTVVDVAADTPAAGYAFDAWTGDTAYLANPFSASTTFTMPSANASITATYRLLTYTVSYRANAADDGAVPADQTKTHGIDLTLASNSGNLVKTGYTFSGWNTAADGSGAGYAESATYSGNADLILYAQWTLNAYSVTFETDGTPGASLTGDTNQVVVHGQSGTAVTANAPVGYQFVNWTKGAEAYSTEVTLNPVNVTENMALVANFMANDAIVITAASDTKVYDGTALVNAGYSITSGTLAAGHTLESVTVTGSQTPVGSSANVPGAAVIRDVSEADVTASYAITYASGTLSVSKATLTVTPDTGQSKVEGTAEPALTYQYTGAAAGETPGFSGALSRAEGESVGSYAIMQGTLALADNASFLLANYTLAFTADVLFAITDVLPSVIPFVEDFEVLAPGNLHGQNGWRASDAVVQTNQARGVQAGAITSEVGFVEQAFAGTETNVWTDFSLQPVFFDGDYDPAGFDGSTVIYFNTNGNPVVYDNTNVVVLTDVQVAAGEWVRVTVHSDYVAGTWDLYINTVRVAPGLRFYEAAVSHYQAMTIKGAGAASVPLDDVQVDRSSPFEILPRLTVISERGSPSPAAGTHSYALTSEINVSMGDASMTNDTGQIQYVCTGWTGTGSGLVSGTDTNFTFTITEDTAITWQWQTNYWVELNTEGE